MQKTLVGTTDDDRFNLVVDPKLEGLSISGRSGDDLLIITIVNEDQEASVSLSGGAGMDTLRVSVVSEGEASDIWNNLTITLEGGSGDDRIIIGSGFVFAYGGDGDDRIQAGANGAYLDGGAGDDLLIGGIGELGNIYDYNEIYGGDGQDLILCGDNGDVVVVNDDQTFDLVYGGMGGDYISFGDEDVVYGGDGMDTFIVELNLVDELAEDDLYYFFGNAIDFTVGEDLLEINLGDLSGLEVKAAGVDGQTLWADTNQGMVTFDFSGLGNLGQPLESLEAHLDTEKIFNDHGDLIGLVGVVSVESGVELIGDILFTYDYDSILGG